MLLLNSDLFNILSYQRKTIVPTEYFRLISAQLIHINIKHFAVNIFALLLAYFLAFNINQIKIFCSSFIFCLILTGIGIHLFLTDVLWYAGSSGFLHGVFLVLFLFNVIMKPSLFSYFLLVCFLIKIIFEMITGNSIQTGFDFNVIQEAHFIGAMAGVIFFILTFKMVKKDNL